MSEADADDDAARMCPAKDDGGFDRGIPGVYRPSAERERPRQVPADAAV